MASSENRGKTAPEAVLAYCTSWTLAAYQDCWLRSHEVAPVPTTEEKKDASLAVARELMAMLRHEAPASASEPMGEPTVLQITGDLGSDSEPKIMAGSFLGTYGKLDIDTAGHWTYRATETGLRDIKLRDIKENGPDWVTHFDRFFVTREDGSVQTLTITLRCHRNDKVKETKASPTVGARVSPETFGENNEPNLRLAAWLDLNRKLPDPDQFDGPAPVPLWVEGRPGDDMPRREVTQDELRHLRLYPERDELSGGGLRFVGLLFFNAAERLPVEETKGSDNAAAEPKTFRKRDAEADAKLRNRIELVLAIALRRWPDPEKRPEIAAMAEELARLHGKKFLYKSETIRKILNGTYGPQVRLKIAGL